MTESSLDSTIEFVRTCITAQQDKFLALPWYAWRERGKIRALLANFEAERDTLVELQKSLKEKTGSRDEARGSE